jgi:hypothetical protein
LAVARGEIAPKLADALGRLLDAEEQAMDMAIAVGSRPVRLIERLRRNLKP